MAKENKVAESIINGITRLSVLEIKTIVGDFELSADGADITEVPGKSDAIVTRMNMLLGDIRTGMSSKFLESPYSSLRDFHAEREKQGFDLVMANVKALKALMSLFDDANKSKDAPAKDPQAPSG